MQPEYYHASRPNSGAMGTRVFQMALYIVLESGIQMLADTPTRYYQDAECTRFIASVPTTWDQTRCLAAQAGKYVVVARRKGTKWYVSGITGNTPVELDVSLDFLGEGRHRMTVFRDGCNAGYQAMRYNQSVQTVDRHTALKVTMARNGGFAAEIDAP